MSPLTPPEVFGPENLSDKINGKAELYLAAGFVSLESRRFKRTERPESWMELFVYDMGSMRNAFSVFSMQRRADAEAADVARFAYRTGNALFFVHGQHYVEAIATDESLGEELLALGRSFVQQRPLQGEALGELALFPAQDLDVSSIALHAADVFGFSRLDRTFTAEYAPGGKRVMAFLSRRDTPAEALELAAAYRQFLVENGGSALDPDASPPGVHLVQIFDTFEAVFSHGRMLAGVHDAESADAAREMAMRLYRELEQSNGEKQ